MFFLLVFCATLVKKQDMNGNVIFMPLKALFCSVNPLYFFTSHTMIFTPQGEDYKQRCIAVLKPSLLQLGAIVTCLARLL